MVGRERAERLVDLLPAQLRPAGTEPAHPQPWYRAGGGGGAAPRVVSHRL
jgi:hypothetical protein